MPKFKYKVKNSNGETLEQEAEDFSKESLVEKLQKQGYFVLKVAPVEAPKKKPQSSSAAQAPGDKKFHHKKVKLSDQITFARQLVTMLESGVTLLRALEIILDQVESRKFYGILRQVTDEVEQGESLSVALSKHPKYFDQFWVSLVEVGEAAGTMPKVLNRLAFYLEQQAKFRSTIVSAVMYPVVLFFICMGAVAFFALFVGPRFENIFNSMGVELPLITKVLMGSFKFIKMNFFKIVGTIVLGVFLLRKYFKTTVGRRHKENLLFSLPTIGNVYRLIVVERFTSQMAILVDSGVPILHALDITRRLVDNSTCARHINEIKESVRQGELLAAPMQKTGFFPGMAIQMITVGEETGELSKMLKHVADFYQETVETFMKRMGTLIEPFMLVFMGAVIGVIVLAMFLPMFNIAQLGGG
ncbi:MAG: type II secretion system F family protein, partial [Candidatus Omnitrophota bacterium]